MIGALIGALRATLGLNAQGFVSGAQQAQNSLVNLVTHSKGAAKQFTSLGGGLQNIGRQVADIGTQLGTGTPLGQVLGQQLPQLFEGFGVYGALAGAAVAVGIPLVRWMVGATDQAEVLEDATKNLTKATESYIGAMKDASLTQSQLIDSYGRNYDEVKKLFDLTQQLAGLDFSTAMSSAVTSIADQLSVVNEQMNQLSQFSNMAWVNQLDPLQAGINALSSSMKISREDAKSLWDALQNLNHADGPEATADAAQHMADVIVEAKGGFKNLDGQARALVATLLDVAASGYKAAAGIREAALSQLDLNRARIEGIKDADAGVTIGDQGKQAAANLIKERNPEKIVDSYNKAYREEYAKGMEERSKEIDALEKRHAESTKSKDEDLGTEGARNWARDQQQRKAEEDLAARLKYIREMENAINKPAKKTGGGGSSAESDADKEAKKNIEDLKDAAQQLYDDTRTPMEQFSEKIREMSNLWKLGYIDVDTYRRGIKLATEDLRDLENQADNVGTTIKESFKDALSQSLMDFSNFASAASSFLNQVGSALVSSGVNWFVDSISGGITKAASGTPYHPGGWSLVGEHGPELARFPKGTRIFPNEAMSGMMGGGSSTVHISLSPGLKASIVGEAARNSVVISGSQVNNYDKTLPDRITRMSNRSSRFK